MDKYMKEIIRIFAEFFGYQGKLTRNDFRVFVVVFITIIIFVIILLLS